MLLCDFCCERGAKVEWRYPCNTFSVGDERGGGTSVGDWAACSTCHQLIEENNREELLNRSFRQFKINNPGMMLVLGKAQVEGMRSQIQKLHTAFFEKRSGIARKETSS